jgi:hypothetical protein
MAWIDRDASEGKTTFPAVIAERYCDGSKVLPATVVRLPLRRMGY